MTRLRSGQVAQAAGVNVQTLRYYERRGLLAAPERSLGGHRLYPPGAVATVEMIKTAQRLGFTLDEVADLLRISRSGGGGGSGLQARAHTKLVEVQARIDELQRVADTLRAAIEAGCDSPAECVAQPRCPLATAAAE